MVRPWKPPSAATMWVRPVRRVSLNAASLASVPELEKNTRPLRRRAASSSRSASSTCGSLAKKFETWPRVCELAGDRLDQRRVGVAERVDRDAAEQVEVLLAVGVPDVRALAADERPAAAGRRCSSARRRTAPATSVMARSLAACACALPGLGRHAGQHQGADALVGEDLEQDRVRLAAVDHGGARDAVLRPP